MKKFKLIWCERVEDSEGYLLHMEQKTEIVEAESEDAACDQWQSECDENLCNGLDECIEVVEHDLFKKHLILDMPDGLTYAVPVEFIARHRAEYYSHKKYEGDVAESLRADTLPLFESDNYEIRDWAANNMRWSDVKNHSHALKKKVPDSDFEDAWCNGEYQIK